MNLLWKSAIRSLLPLVRSPRIRSSAVALCALLCACGPTPPDPGPGSGGGPSFDPSGRSPCKITASDASCKTKSIVTVTLGTDTRRIYWNEPVSAAPAGGFPAVVLYQGSIYGPSLSWDIALAKSTAFGGYAQVALIALLIDNGFVVIQPEAPGGIAWDTNIAADYASSSDSRFIPALLDRMRTGTFGSIDMTQLYATGIPSGGYMTSRMAVSYPGRFRALAIESASYATCVGPLCSVPERLPADHPPTLLLHGSVDVIVPIATARDYEAKLKKNAIEAAFVEDKAAGHQWLDAAPVAVTRWFMSH